MKKVSILICLLICLFIEFSYAQTLSKRQLKQMNKSASSLFKGQCPLERVEWMEVSEGYDKNAMINIATEIQAAAKTDAETIKKIADGSASAKITSDFSNTINKLTQKNVKVSQGFYEQYLMMRTPVCNIYQSIQDGLYKNNPAALMKAQDLFIEMNNSWLKYIQEEEKKNRP